MGYESEHAGGRPTTTGGSADELEFDEGGDAIAVSRTIDRNDDPRKSVSAASKAVALYYDH